VQDLVARREARGLCDLLATCVARPTSYTYDSVGNAATSEDPSGVTTTNTYNPLNKVASVSYSSSAAPSVSYTYDASGDQTGMVDGTGTSSYSYDPFGEMTDYESGAGETVSYEYNDEGTVAAITYPLGAGATWATTHTVNYTYDNTNELTSMTDFAGNSISIGENADGLPN
jgi:YD repeat-containing protein